ncbi:hypothetical protein B9Z40_10685 [Limnohabitans sp. 15K]|nr:hypothetical protein B9Z40_10685 [Limnohabitans sp. 15K]
MNLVKQKQDQLEPTWPLAAHRQTLAAHDQSLPLSGGLHRTPYASDRQKVTEKVGTTFAGIDTSPLNLSGQRQKTDVP